MASWQSAAAPLPVASLMASPTSAARATAEAVGVAIAQPVALAAPVLNATRVDARGCAILVSSVDGWVVGRLVVLFAASHRSRPSVGAQPFSDGYNERKDQGPNTRFFLLTFNIS